MDWLLGIGVGVLLGAIMLRQVASATIFEYERALRFVNGRLRDVVGAGSYWHLRRTTTFRRVDIRPATLAVTGQEVLSADGVAFKLSLLATYQVTDPRRAILGVDDFHGALHAQLQLALREIVAATPAEDLIARRVSLGPQLLAIAGPPATEFGVSIAAVAVRDLTLPGDLKKVFSQVVRARQEGLATLERARGETAALRHLANAAGMVQQNPVLLQLRLLQLLEQQPGHTVVLGGGEGVLPIAARGRQPGPAPDPGGTRDGGEQ